MQTDCYNQDSATPRKRQGFLPPSLGIFTTIETATGRVTCYGEKSKLKSGYEVVEVLCPFCWQRGEIVFHTHGYSPGVTGRLSHCDPNRYKRREYLISANDEAGA